MNELNMGKLINFDKCQNGQNAELQIFPQCNKCLKCFTVFYILFVDCHCPLLVPCISVMCLMKKIDDTVPLLLCSLWINFWWLIPLYNWNKWKEWLVSSQSLKVPYNLRNLKVGALSPHEEAELRNHVPWSGVKFSISISRWKVSRTSDFLPSRFYPLP